MEMELRFNHLLKWVNFHNLSTIQVFVHLAPLILILIVIQMIIIPYLSQKLNCYEAGLTH